MQYTYGVASPFAAPEFGLIGEVAQRIWRNFPPAVVWRFRRLAAPAPQWPGSVAWTRADQSGRQHFEHVAVRIAEIEAAAAAAVVDRHVLERTRAAAIDDAVFLDAREDRVELGRAYLEGIVVVLEAGIGVEIERQSVVDADRGEVGHRAGIAEAEDAGKKPRRSSLSRAGTMVWSSMIAIGAS